MWQNVDQQFKKKITTTLWALSNAIPTRKVEEEKNEKTEKILKINKNNEKNEKNNEKNEKNDKIVQQSNEINDITEKMKKQKEKIDEQTKLISALEKKISRQKKKILSLKGNMLQTNNTNSNNENNTFKEKISYGGKNLLSFLNNLVKLNPNEEIPPEEVSHRHSISDSSELDEIKKKKRSFRGSRLFSSHKSEKNESSSNFFNFSQLNNNISPNFNVNHGNIQNSNLNINNFNFNASFDGLDVDRQSILVYDELFLKILTLLQKENSVSDSKRNSKIVDQEKSFFNEISLKNENKINENDNNVNLETKNGSIVTQNKKNNQNEEENKISLNEQNKIENQDGNEKNDSSSSVETPPVRIPPPLPPKQHPSDSNNENNKISGSDLPNNPNGNILIDRNEFFASKYKEIEDICSFYFKNKSILTRLRKYYKPSNNSNPQDSKEDIVEEKPFGFILNITPIQQNQSSEDNFLNEEEKKASLLTTEKKNKMEKERSLIVNEVIKTERDFVNDLEIFDKIYISGLENFNNSPSFNKDNPKFKQFLFYCVSVRNLKLFSQNLLKQMEESVIDHNFDLIVPIFSRLGPFFKIYQEFCTNLSIMNNYLKDLIEKDKEFKLFHEK